MLVPAPEQLSLLSAVLNGQTCSDRQNALREQSLPFGVLGPKDGNPLFFFILWIPVMYSWVTWETSPNDELCSSVSERITQGWLKMKISLKDSEKEILKWARSSGRFYLMKNYALHNPLKLTKTRRQEFRKWKQVFWIYCNTFPYFFSLVDRFYIVSSTSKNNFLHISSANVRFQCLHPC